MDPTVARRAAGRQYAALRQALIRFEERVVARYWDENTPVRVGFERFLGSLDEAAGWLLADDELSRRGRDLLRRTRPAAAPGSAETPAGLAGEPGTVDVTFTLPAQVQADRVALCGEFNDWATDAILLARGSDGSWQAIVPLEPGRAYRYRYLLDGERWENAWQADRYVPNSYGTADSVVVVE